MTVSARAVGAVVFFIACSLAAVMLNKALFASLHFPCPMLMTSIQLRAGRTLWFVLWSLTPSLARAGYTRRAGMGTATSGAATEDSHVAVCGGPHHHDWHLGRGPGVP